VLYTSQIIGVQECSIHINIERSYNHNTRAIPPLARGQLASSDGSNCNTKQPRHQQHCGVQRPALGPPPRGLNALTSFTLRTRSSNLPREGNLSRLISCGAPGRATQLLTSWLANLLGDHICFSPLTGGQHRAHGNRLFSFGGLTSPLDLHCTLVPLPLLNRPLQCSIHFSRW